MSTFFLFPCLLVLLLVSCSVTWPTFKIGLVAPFEGRYRAVGYDAIYAARLAVRQANAASPSCYRVELIAFDDGGNPELALRQAQTLALDPAVVGVIGHFRADTTQAALPIYAREKMPVLVPANVPADASVSVIYLGPTIAQLDEALASRQIPAGEKIDSDFSDVAALADANDAGRIFATGAPWPQDVPGAEQFIADYVAVSGGAPPGPFAWAAYQAVRTLLAATHRAIRSSGSPSRADVQTELRSAKLAPPVYVYRCDATGHPVIQK